MAQTPPDDEQVSADATTVSKTDPEKTAAPPKLGDAARHDASGSSDEEEAKLARLWIESDIAEEYAPVPCGTYDAVLVGGEKFHADRGTPGFRLVFRLNSEEFGQRKVEHVSWLTPRAMKYARRELGKVGIIEPNDLKKPVDAGLICRVRVAIDALDDGREFNRVKNFTVIGRGPAPYMHPNFPLEQEEPSESVGDDIEF